MKKSTKILIIALVVALIAAAAIYFLTRTEKGAELVEKVEEQIAVLDQPDSFEAKVSLDKDAALFTMLGGDMTEQVKMISSLLDALTIKGVSYKDTAELDLFAGEDAIVTIGAKSTDEGMTIASSLLGENVIYASAEQLKNMTQQTGAAASGNVDFTELMDAIKKLDEKQLQKDCDEVGEEMKKAIEAKKGEAEKGEFTVDGFSFTSKAPVNMTFDELTEIEIDAVKKLIAKESLKPIVDVLSKNTDLAAELDKAAEQMKNQPAEQKYDLNLALYEDGKGSQYYAGEMVQEANKINLHIGFGTVDGADKSNVQGTMDQVTMDIVSSAKKDGASEIKANISATGVTANITGTGDASGNADILADINAQGMPANIHVTVTDGEGNRKNFKAEVFVMSTDKALLTVNGTAGKGGEILSAFEGEKINVIPMEKLTDNSDQNTVTTISTTAVSNLLSAINTLKKNLPEDTANWVNTLFASLIPQN